MKSKFFRNSYRNVFDASKKALNTLKMYIEKEDYNRCTIIASSDTSIFSWGENIQIRFEQVSQGVKITVESNSKAQLIDWGKNDSNENEVIDKISDILDRR